MAGNVYILGGWQTDFAQNWTREGLTIFDMMAETTLNAMDAAKVDPADIEVAHVGNFAGELYCDQGHLGGMFTAIDPKFVSLPTMRHEAACASGSMAALSAMADIESGRYDLACVLGVELMRSVPGDEATRILGTAAWTGREAQEARYVWPHLFNRLAEEYGERYGIRHEHLGRIAEINMANGRRNPNAQTRKWVFTEKSFAEDDEANPVIDGMLRRNDCGQVSDGAAAIFLASEKAARRHADRLGIALEDIPVIKGWGHRTGPMRLQDKLDYSRNADYILPHVKATVDDAFRRAGIGSVFDVDGLEIHDCFSATEYMAIDHFGITAPGESWKAIEEGWIEIGGRIPINPSGGLIGLGHPVGATGVRQLLDCYKQVTGTAGDYQIEGARNFATLNVGGSATTTASFVVGRH
jgi:acetyl-CoA C-acetyltransferase